jgi:hypothetical protein
MKFDSTADTKYRFRFMREVEEHLGGYVEDKRNTDDVINGIVEISDRIKGMYPNVDIKYLLHV